MQLNDTQDIDTLDNIQNVKGSEDKDHVFGSNNNNTLEGSLETIYYMVVLVMIEY